MTTPPPPPHVKVCGLTRLGDALLAAELGASYFGVILTGKSPRHMPPRFAADLLHAFRNKHPEGRWIGVFVDEPVETIVNLARQLDLFAVQVHGPTAPLLEYLDPKQVIPAIAMKSEADAARAEALDPAHYAILTDAFSPVAHGGTGKRFEHRWVQPLFPSRQVFVAGGLRPDNIGEVVHALAPGPYPHAFDLSSGIEDSPGIKAPALLREFFASFNRAFAA